MLAQSRLLSPTSSNSRIFTPISNLLYDSDDAQPVRLKATPSISPLFTPNSPRSQHIKDAEGNIRLSLAGGSDVVDRAGQNDLGPMVVRNARRRINGLEVGHWDNTLDSERLRMEVVESWLLAFLSGIYWGCSFKTRTNWLGSLFESYHVLARRGLLNSHDRACCYPLQR